MNIWAWVERRQDELVEAGHDRLAFLVDAVPQAVVADAHDHADLLVDEGIALARSVRDDWLELFFRHWMLQSRVLHRMEGKSALDDAVALVDFAHDAGRDRCPQSVCAIQDLAACYGFVDGPGYAAERRRVADETLARIDPSWGCFHCISSEYAHALIDERRAEEALVFLDGQEAKAIAAGEPRRATTFVDYRVEAYLALGRFDEAEALLDAADAADEPEDDEHSVVERRMARARVHAMRADGKRALRVLPSDEDIEATPFFYRHYFEIVDALVRIGSLANDASLGARLERYLRRIERQGVVRATFELATIAARLAASRGDTPHLDVARARMRRLRPALRADLGADAALRAVDALVAPGTGG